MDLITSQEVIENILNPWRTQIGAAFHGYRGHVYRTWNICLALRSCSADEQQKLAVIAAFHDLGLWSDNTADYLEPSATRAAEWLQQHGRNDWIDEVTTGILLHHKLRSCTTPPWPTTEVFRRADLIDVTCGLVRFQLPRGFLRRLRATFPNAGFHRFLLIVALQWIPRHPLRPLPFIRW